MLSLNVCFHAEQLDDDDVYRRTTDFCRQFREVTGVGAWLCVMTPECRKISARLRASGFSPDRYAERILTLAEVAEIGYHGHCYGDNGEKLHGTAFRIAHAQAQMPAELAWLRALGLSPRIYTGGWWLITPELLGLLAAEGFRLDLSTRGNEPAYGYRYPADVPSVGSRFGLVRPITEIGSLPYGLSPWPYYLAMMQEMLPQWGERPLWATIPLHDYDLLTAGGHEWRIVERLARTPYVRWVDSETALLPG